MNSQAVDGVNLGTILKAIRRELACLSERVAVLEAAAQMMPLTIVPPGASASAAAPAADGITEELLLVISAAVATFLGMRPHTRQIRLIGSTAWSQQGRVSIQASHVLPVQHR